MVPSLGKDPLKGSAAVGGGLIGKPVEEIEGAVVAERPGAEGPHLRLTARAGSGCPGMGHPVLPPVPVG